MNWTGGALSRSRNTNAKASLSVKQKNHFAKARVKPPNGQQAVAPEIQYFDFGEWKPESRVRDDRQSNLVKRGASSQRTLDQFQNVKGVVRKLTSLQPRVGRNKRKRSLINDTEGYVLPSGIPIPPISPTIINSHSHSSSSPIRAEPTEKRVANQLQPSTSSTSDELYPLAALDSVEAKRRRLLQESDWVGIERQRCLSKPVKMKFTDAEDRDLIGRRRPLNGSAIQNRWNVQCARSMKIPLMAPCDEGVENWNPDGMSIRIGSTATSKGPILDEMLDCYQAPELANRSAHPVQSSEYTKTVHEPRSQHQTREATTPSSLGKASSEPFRSLFSPEEVDQSGVAQLVEASTIAEDDIPAFMEDELQLPEDYRFPEPEPRFRLVFDQTPQPRGQTSEPDRNSDPNVRDFAFTKREPQGAAVERPAYRQDHNMLKDQLSQIAPIHEAGPSTSPLSIATSRYMQELEDQSFGAGGPRLLSKNVADSAASTRAQPAVNRDTAENEREPDCDPQPKASVQREEVQDQGSIQPTEDEDEIWRDFINLDDLHDSPPSQRNSTQVLVPHTTATAPLQNQQARDQPSTISDAQKAPPHPPDDDEQIWRDFIFSSPNPNDNGWPIEEASPEPPSPNSHASTYDPARTQPSMVAEVATSPVKQNPHLLDEMLDDSPPVLDNASRYAHASTSSTGIPDSTEDVSTTAPPQPLYPSSWPTHQSSSTLTTASSPGTRNGPNPLRTTSSIYSSSLLAQASPSSSTDTTSRPPPNSPSDEPSRPPRTEKVTFTKPSRYIGQRAPGTAQHLGRRVGRQTHKMDGNGKRMGKKTKSLAEAVERAKRQMSRKEKRDESETEETEQDEIVDD